MRGALFRIRYGRRGLRRNALRLLRPAVLQYAITMRPAEWPEDVQSDDDTETRPWHYFLIEMLIAVLPGMAVQS
jgi:hypothetical protein